MHVYRGELKHTVNISTKNNKEVLHIPFHMNTQSDTFDQDLMNLDSLGVLKTFSTKFIGLKLVYILSFEMNKLLKLDVM